MVYTAGSLSLALLEWRVHLAKWPSPPVAVVRVEFDQRLVWMPAAFPRDWNHHPCLPSTAAFGDAWIKSMRSAIMRVPSSVVPDEWNYLINPGHPDFSQLSIGRAKTVKLDHRLGPVS
jgi:RES domain-containing protein